MKQMLIALGFPKPPININCFQLFSKVEAKVSFKGYILTLCILGNFSCLFFVCRIFSKLTFSKSSFRNTIRLSNALDRDLGPNCLQRLSADDKFHGWQANSYRIALVWIGVFRCLSTLSNTIIFLTNWQIFISERSGSVEECLTQDRRAVGSSLTGITALCP